MSCDAACNSSRNCRSVDSSAASGMLLTRPSSSSRSDVLRMLPPAGPLSMRTGISILRRPLFRRQHVAVTALRRVERLVEIADDVVDVLDADAQADHLRPHAGLAL